MTHLGMPPVNLFAFLSLAGAVMVILFGAFIFHNQPRSPHHRLFLALCVVIGWWAFSEFGYRHAQVLDTAEKFMRLGLIWPFAYALMVHFTLSYTGFGTGRMRTGLLAAAYSVTGIIVAGDMAGGLIDRVGVMEGWGNFSFVVQPSAFAFFRLIMLALLGSAAVGILFRFLRTCVAVRTRRQVQWLLAGYLVPVAANIVEDLLLLTGAASPEITILTVVASCFIIGYGVWRYQLFSASGKMVSRYVLPLIPDPLLVLNTDGVIEDVNDVACRVTGYQRAELVGQRMKKICPSCCRHLSGPGGSVRKAERFEGELHCRDGSVIPFAMASTLVGFGPGAGYTVLLGRDISAQHSRRQAQAEVQKMLEDKVASRTFLLEQALASRSFLWRSAASFASVGPDTDLNALIADQLRGFLPAAVIVVTSYIEKDRMLRVERLSGLERYLDKVVSVFGADPVGMAFPVPEVGVMSLTDAKLHEIEGGFREIAPQVHGTICIALEKLLNVTGLYSIGMVEGRKLFGSITIITRHGDSLAEKEAVETFVSQASTAMQRQSAERAIHSFSRGVIQEREEEMRNLATSLHDELGSLSVGLNADLGILEADLREGKRESALAGMAKIRGLVRDEVAKLKRISHTLRPLNLEILGLARAINELAGYTSNHSGVVISCRLDEMPDELTDTEAIHLYRIVQEALNNTVRHARASSVKVYLRNDGGSLALTVADDGCGFDEQRVSSGNGPIRMGLIGMRERAAAIGGSLHIVSDSGAGTAITVTMKPGRAD